MLFLVSSLVGIVLLSVLLERGMFFEQFWCKTKILFKHIFMQNSNQSTICTLINLLSWITVKRVYMAYMGQKIIDVCVDICVMMSSDLYGTCSSADVIVMSRTNSNLPYGTRPAQT